tara:strand:+ start:628 stop:1164 length:537 start_codon:yes stop_codon:yes gene_type:complete
MAYCPPKTPATGCLDVIIQESIILPNFNTQQSYNEFTVCGINNYVTRTEIIDYRWSGSGIGIIDFVGSPSEQTPGSFVNSDVKYIRITNIPTSPTFASIYIIKTNKESALFKIEPGRSLVLSSDEFDASSTTDYVDETYADKQYFDDFIYMSEIKAKAGDSNGTFTGSIKIEYVVASA